MTTAKRESPDVASQRAAGIVPTLGQSFPLTPFEKYFLSDERRTDFPATIPMRWTVSQAPQAEAFAHAFRSALAWHPMLGCVVNRGDWQPHPSATSEVAFFDSGEQPSLADRTVDAHRGPVIRCNVLESDASQQGETAVIEIIVHHAVIDGVSLVEFIGDVFALYANAIGALDSSKLRQPHHRYLAQRFLVDRQVPAPVGRLTVWKVIAKETIQFFRRRAEPLVCDQRPRKSLEPTAWHLVDEALDRESTVRLMSLSSTLNVSLNDCAVASLLRVIANWNDTHGRRPGNGWLVANMPVLLRPRAAVRTSAANMIGYGLLAQRRAALANWSSLVQRIAADSRFIQQWKMAAMFLDGLSVASRIPGGMFVCTRTTQPATCVVTHVGDPMRRFRVKFPVNEDGFPVVGDLTLLKISGAAPLRPGTHVAGALSMLGGRLSLSLRVPPSRVSLETARSLIALWKQDLLSQ